MNKYLDGTDMDAEALEQTAKEFRERLDAAPTDQQGRLAQAMRGEVWRELAELEKEGR